MLYEFFRSNTTDMTINAIHPIPSRFRFVVAMLAAVLMLAAGGTLHAQQFGKNKVQYRTFKWKYIQTDHFDIYFYDDAGKYLSKFTAQVAENALDQIQSHWRYRITNRIPIVIYNSHTDFQQTNVVSEFMPEGVGGVTELFKNRMTLPFEGDWEQFRHVIHHELTHAVLNDKFYGGSLQNIISNNIRFMLPIWMNEGLAEFESEGGYDIQTDMFIRDAVIGEYLPSLENLNGYFAYRGGQAFYWYVEQNYGREKIAELLNRCRATGNLDAAFKGAFGKTVREFSDQWLYDLKKIYWPDIADRKRPVDFAVRLTDHKRDESFYNTSPSISPNGNKVAFISDRDGPRSVYVMDIDNPRSIRELITGEINTEFEELHLLTPSIAWSPDSRKVSMAVKSKGHDAAFVIDVETGDRVKLPIDLDAIYAVEWSPDGKKLTFQGIKGEQPDIYLYDFATKKMTNLTNDIFFDTEPQWGADSKTIYFISDRRDNPIGTAKPDSFLIWNYDYRGRDLFDLNTETMQLTRLTNSDEIKESAPVVGPDGRVLYISDKNGINNIYVLDPKTGATRALTNSISGIEHLSISRDGGKLVFTSWNGDGQDVFLLRMPFDVKLDADTLAPTTYLKRSALVASAVTDTTHAADTAVKAVTDLHGYGGVKLDIAEAMPSTPPTTPATGASKGAEKQLAPASDSKTVTGDYAVKDYKIRFSPDFIQASGNYNSFYGVQGAIQMLFSDMLGDHQIFFATDLQLDLKNSSFVLSYLYLPERIDYGIDIFQSSILSSPTGYYDDITRFRQWGATAKASNPFDRFSRLDVGLTWLNVSRDPVGDNSVITSQSKMMLVPSIGYVFDDSQDWAFGPVQGSRYNMTALASPKFGQNGVGFYTLMGDFRHYLPLDKYGTYSLAARIAGGGSFGPNPQKFFLGGVENWLNYQYANGRIPIDNVEDFTFLTPGYPLRGYDYGERVTSKYLLSNIEFRFPLFQALVSGPIPVFFQYVAGAIFLDAGAAWDDHLALTTVDPATGQTVSQDMLLGTGAGARAYVFGIPLRFDVAWNYNLQSWSRPKYYLSLGYDF